jgi:hypothetical protein
MEDQSLLIELETEGNKGVTAVTADDCGQNISKSGIWIPASGIELILFKLDPREKFFSSQQILYDLFLTSVTDWRQYLQRRN